MNGDYPRAERYRLYVEGRPAGGWSSRKAAVRVGRAIIDYAHAGEMAGFRVFDSWSREERGDYEGYAWLRRVVWPQDAARRESPVPAGGAS